MDCSNFYAFTGGPGSGKTTVLDYLSKSGYTVVGETAREIIKSRTRQGLPSRPELKEFAKLMLLNDLDNFNKFNQSKSPVLFDRSFQDSLCLLHEYDRREYELMLPDVKDYRVNPGVFIFPPWAEIYKNDEERDQTFTEAVEVFEKLANWYTKERYTLIEVPKVPVEKRAEFILRQIDKGKWALRR